MVSLLPQDVPSRPRTYTIRLSRPEVPTVAKMASPRTHNYNYALQKYMLLQEQHEELCSHLDQIRPGLSLTHTTSSSSPCASPSRASSLSTTSSRSSSSGSSSRRHSRSRQARRCSGWEAEAHLDTIVDEVTISAEEQRLCDVNESIKRALTELLNCEAVRCDQQMRMWVQGRLMETEKELRSGRRRKGSME